MRLREAPSAAPAGEKESPGAVRRRTPGERFARIARRPVVVHRHLARGVAHGLALVTSDLAFSYLATLVMAALVALGVPGTRLVPHVAQLVRGGGDEPLYFAASLLIGLLIAGAYRVRRQPHPLADILAGCTIAVGIVYWSPTRILGLQETLPSFLLTVIVLGAIVAMGRQVAERLIAMVPAAAGMTEAIVVGRPEDCLALVDSPLRDPLPRLVGFVSLDGLWHPGAMGVLDELPGLAARYRAETVVIASRVDDVELRAVIELALAGGCTLLYPARSMRIAGVRPNLVWRGDEPYFEVGAPALRGQEVFLKRIVDVVGAIVGLVVLAPFIALVAAAIKLDSQGPVFFVQHRAGMFGRRFRMLKFRTMRHGADAEKQLVAHLNRTGDTRLFKIEDDPRVTRLGRWLRRWSIDELPQFWNVLLGDMSLVGPRPFFESDMADYEAHHFRRLDVKPGITGLWQVTGRSDVIDFDEVVRLDREYIERWSLWMDLKILALTLPSVLRRDGAY